MSSTAKYDPVPAFLDASADSEAHTQPYRDEPTISTTDSFDSTVELEELESFDEPLSKSAFYSERLSSYLERLSSYSPWFSRAGVIGAIAFVIVTLVLSLNQGYLLPPSWTQSKSYVFDLNKGLSPERARHRTMDAATCKAEFPLLFPQLDENVKAWHKKGNISYTDIELAAIGLTWGMARVVIRDGQLYFRQVNEGGESRTSALLHLLHDAVTSAPAEFTGVNDTGIELVFSEADRDASPSNIPWVLSKKYSDDPDRGIWLLPDFGFAGWPEAGIASFSEFMRQARLADHLVPWPEKGNKVFWRGFINDYKPRIDLLARTDPRKVPGADEWADVHQTSFHEEPKGEFFPIIPMQNHCKYKYLIQTEGNSYSGRGKFLWACDSVVVSHPLNWTQHFQPALNSNSSDRAQNFVQLPGPFFEGLEDATRELWRYDNVSASEDIHSDGHLGINPPQRIAQNAVETLRYRYLTPAAMNCYTRAALKAYQSVLRIETWPTDGNSTAWGDGNVGIVPQGGPGGGVGPDGGKNKDYVAKGIKGDIEYGVWRLSGSPNWPPKPK